MVSDKLVSEKKLSAVTVMKEISSKIDGGGGGQPFLAIAGGKNPSGLNEAIDDAEKFLRKP
jgi:alanyl-tRNA synthetase